MYGLKNVPHKLVSFQAFLEIHQHPQQPLTGVSQSWVHWVFTTMRKGPLKKPAVMPLARYYKNLIGTQHEWLGTATESRWHCIGFCQNVGIFHDCLLHLISLNCWWVAGVLVGRGITIIHLSWGRMKCLFFERCAHFLHLVDTSEHICSCFILFWVT